eukprot:CAMPEP_0181347362 /NCGR_PEP_ID=MMETSP1101-20121128/33838_1 /TAXON_ID=46948 /ORGANISM="Rhodomonas abbreviata, Strain Caron Lab Isolate" /LENGTH=209 /DNA_ID=CAMNT_0023459571 /DNA_START=118 /DNA_END=744 /DNA_ORIENTATION=-
MAEMYANEGGGGTNLKEFFERAQDPEELVKALQNAARERNLPAFSEPAMQVLRDQEITGPDLLLMTKEEIISYGMKGGPSTRIMALVEEARGLHSSHGSEFGSLQPLRGGGKVALSFALGSGFGLLAPFSLTLMSYRFRTASSMYLTLEILTSSHRRARSSPHLACELFIAMYTIMPAICLLRSTNAASASHLAQAPCSWTAPLPNSFG